MTNVCPRSDDLTRLLDGEASENLRRSLREPLGACQLCSGEYERLRSLLGDLAAPVLQMDVNRGVQELLGRLDDACPRSQPKMRRNRWLALAAGAMAVAATIVIAVSTR